MPIAIQKSVQSVTFAYSFDRFYLPQIQYALTGSFSRRAHFASRPEPIFASNMLLLHLYGSALQAPARRRRHGGVTIAVPEPTAKEAQLFKDALQRQEQQNESSTPSKAM